MAMMKLKTLPMLAAVLLAVTACDTIDDILEGEEERIPGERIPVRASADERMVTPEQRAQIERIGPATQNADWPQVNADADHATGHLAAGGSLSVAWTADIGAGAGGEGTLISAPVVAEGKVFTLDAAAQVSAFAASGGGVAWRISVAPGEEDGEDGFGGGLAYEGGLLFVTTGFGEIIALDAGNGNEIWRQRVSAPVRAAPTVGRGAVIVIARDNTAYAYNVTDGQLRWRIAGASSGAGVLGGASAAISAGGTVVVPFGSGELVAVNAATGRKSWSDVISGGRRGFARSAISDISADPVIQGVAVISGNSSGILTAIDGRSGRRGWTRAFGAAGPVWVDGQTMFVVTDDAQLKRLSLQDGATLWSASLPEYEDPKDREDLIRYGGPVLAGGRVLITSTEERLMAFDPLTGAQTAAVEIDDLSGIGPVVAGGMVYVLTLDGKLVALR